MTSLAGMMARDYARARRRDPRRSRRRCSRRSCRAPPATPCRRRARARCCRWPTGSTCWPGCSPSARKPTGSSRPVRACAGPLLGVVAILREHPELRAITLPVGLAAAAEQIGAQGIEVPDESLAEVGRVHRPAVRAAAARRGDDHLQVAAVLPLADGARAGRRDAGRAAAPGRRRQASPSWSRHCSAPGGSCRPTSTAAYDAVEADRAGRAGPARGRPEGRYRADRRWPSSSRRPRCWSSRSPPSSRRSW